MSFLAFLLSAAGAALSLYFSGAWDLILGDGLEFTWLKEFAALAPLVKYVMVSAALGVLGALLSLAKKNIAAVLPAAAAGILAYVQFSMHSTYPYSIVVIFLYIAAALTGWRLGEDAEGEAEAVQEAAAEETAFEASGEMRAAESGSTETLETEVRGVSAGEAAAEETAENALSAGTPVSETAKGPDISMPAAEEARSEMEFSENAAESSAENVLSGTVAPVTAAEAIREDAAEKNMESGAYSVPEAASETEQPAEPLPVQERAETESSSAVSAADPDEGYSNPTFSVNCRGSRLWSVLFAAAAAAVALYESGLFSTLMEHGRDLSWLQDFALFDAKTMLAAATAVLSLAGALLALMGTSFATLLLLAAAAANGASQISAGGAYPLTWAVFILCMAGAACAWPGERFDRSRTAWRFSWPCIFALVFGLAGVSFALYQSGIGASMCSTGVSAFLDGLMKAELPVQVVTLAVFLGVVGAVLGLFGALLAPWLLAAAAAAFFAADVRLGAAYEFSWLPVALTAAGAIAAADACRRERPESMKRLTWGGALALAVLAAIGTGFLMRRYDIAETARMHEKKIQEDPAYQQMAADLQESAAQRDEAAAKLKEQSELAEERGRELIVMREQITSKDAEISSLNEKAEEDKRRIAELTQNLDEAEAAAKAAAAPRKFLYVPGTLNVREAPKADNKTKIITRLKAEAVEIVGSQTPEGSSTIWYQVKGSFGTGWVSGRNAVIIDLGK